MSSEVHSKSKFDVYEAVTAKIVVAIEAGAGTFTMPWHGGVVPIVMPTNASTDAPYRGVNIVALWADAAIKRYITGYWASYKQWQKLGAQVRKAERGATIVFYKKIDRVPLDGGEEEPPRFVARATTVFNAAQVDGWQIPLPKIKSEVEINDQLEAFVRATKANVRHGGTAARYSMREDTIEMPDRERFRATGATSASDNYYATLLHELTHWTGAAHRLDRTFGARFGDRTYAFEELIAELGSAFLCSAFGIVNEPRPDHAAYVSSWLDILDRDQRAIFTAASKAQQAVEYLAQLAASSA